jgi:cyanate permease
MTPVDLTILFSSYVLTFFIVWFTNFSERDHEPGSQAAERKKPGDHIFQQQMEWNVAIFSGFKKIGVH